MKSLQHFLFASLALVLLLSCVGPANAQGLAGKFTLPYAAHWGKVTLSPGDYRFRMERTNGLVYVESGRANLGMILPASVGRGYTAGNSILVTQIANVKSVRELRLGSSGVVLYFPPANPSNHKVVQTAETRYLITILPFGE
ncbi:MAG TPA: hypothetical protein VMB03_30965 [Bryobacteraceae bacterium]|nr:hypothetical protein [Bryobacteraceae bacterium]